MKVIFEKSNNSDGVNLTNDTAHIDFLPEKFLRTESQIAAII